MENNRIVIDTNVFISAIIGQFGYPYKIFNELVLTGEVRICLSPNLLEEYEEVSQREKFKKLNADFPKKARQLIKALKAIALIAEPQEVLAVIADEPDNRVLEIAVATKAMAIVTGNKHHFNFEEFRGIQIKNPKEFYEEWTA